MSEWGETPMTDAEVRTHLANERTYLAWIRTVIVAMGIGLAAVTLPLDDETLSALADLLGLGIMLVSGMLAVSAVVSYRRAMLHLAQGHYHPAWISALLTLLVPIGIAAAVVAFFLAGK